MKANVREATVRDATWYIELVRSLVAEADSQIPLRPDELFRTEDQQAELFDGASARGDLFLIAEMNGTRVGELNLRRGGRAAFKHSAVLGMAVDQEWRNKGIGSLLMQSAMEWAKTGGALRRIELYVFATNARAIRLYERFGFVTEGRRRGAVRVGDSFVDDLLMACYVQRPNQSVQPMPGSVTPRAIE